jgi:hypothetical protein
MKDNGIYLNEFHRRQHEQAKALLSRRRKQSLADAMKQYDRLGRRKRADSGLRGI